MERSDLRLATNPEGLGQAGTPLDSSIAEERVSNHVRRRAALRRLTDAHSANWARDMPHANRSEVLQLFASAVDTLTEEQSSLFCEEPICDGAGRTYGGDPCPSTLLGQLGAVESFSDFPKGTQELFRRKFLTSDVEQARASVGDAWDTLMSDGELMSIRDRIMVRIARTEHQLHSAGVEMTYSEGRMQSRSLIYKYLFVFTIAFNVPVVFAQQPPSNAWVGVVTDYYEKVATGFRPHLSYSSCVSIPIRVADAPCSPGMPDSICALETLDRVRGHPGGVRQLKLCNNLPIPWAAETAVGLLFAINFVFYGWVGWRFACWYARGWACTMHFVFRVFSRISDCIAHRRVISIMRTAKVPTAMESQPLNDAVTVFQQVLKKSAPDVLEMAMPGSALARASEVPGCLYLMNLSGSVPTHVGMAFRYGQYLVTAGHNALALDSMPGQTILVPFHLKGKIDFSMDLDFNSCMEFKSFAEKDIVPEAAQIYDVCIVALSPGDWSRLGVKSLTHYDAAWHMNVVTFGLERTSGDALQRSLGRIKPLAESDPIHEVHYSASTLKGWSGSPVLTAQKKVVALHCGTNGVVNRGLNFAYVRAIIDFHEYHTLESSPDARELEILKSFRGKNGRLAYRSEEFDFDYEEEQYRFEVSMSKGGVLSFDEFADDTDDFSDIVYDRRETKSQRVDREMGWHESADPAPMSPMQRPPRIQTLDASPAKPPSDPANSAAPKPLLAFTYPGSSPRELFVVEKTNASLSAPYFKGDETANDVALDLPSAATLGYVPGVYEMPRAKSRSEAIVNAKRSLANSLQATIDVNANAKVPSGDVRTMAKRIMKEVLKPLKYAVSGPAVTREKILGFINSSALPDSKSPGMPFVSQSLKSNADVIQHYGVDGLADLVMSAWEDGSWVNHPSADFNKLEPHKKEKLDAGNQREVQAVSIIQQLILRCFYTDLSTACIENWRKVPILAGWSPLKPGDGEALYKRIAVKGHKIIEFDGQAFEFHGHKEFAYSDVTDVMVGLAVPMGLRPQQFAEWRREARETADLAGKVGYLLPDGTKINKNVSAILSSGRFDTYLRNSLTEMYWFVTGMLLIGISKEDVIAVLRKSAIGGDDIVAAVKDDFDLPGLVAVLNSHGLPVHKEKKSDISQGFEFFSWHFSKDNMGEVVWVPTRFTKHIESLRQSPKENWPQSLVSHMANWAHSEQHFEFFKKLYYAGVDAGEEDYYMENIPDRQELKMHYAGDESLGASDVSVLLNGVLLGSHL